MQDIEQRNMDDLFRRAGEGYSLKTGEPGWDAIAPRLAVTPVAVRPHKKSNSKKQAGIGILILLVLVTGIIAVYYPGTGKKQFANRTNAVLQPIITKQQNTPGDLQEKVVIVSPGKLPSLKKQQQSQGIHYSNPVTLSTTVAGNTGNKKSNPNPDTGKFNEQSEGSSDRYKNNTNNEPVNNIPDEPVKYENEQPVNEEIISNSNAPAVTITAEKKKMPAKPNKGFYWGFAAGPQLNEVKHQGTKKAGFDVGILAGYRLNRSLSLETGLFFSRKYYFSDGKYFDMTKAGTSMPAGMKILSLESNASVFEIPAKLRYDVLTGKRSGLFIAAGISSYLLTKEKNNYNAMVNGNPEYMAGSYNKSARYFAAAANLGIGYEYKIGNKNTLRIEPYIQIPLRGIGVGDMPVSGAGLHIGITRKNK